MYKLNYYTQLGNSLVQLSNAINVAREKKTKLILPRRSDKNSSAETFRFLENVPDFDFGDNHVGRHVSKFYFDTQTFGYTLTNEKRRSILQEYVLPHIPFNKVNLPETLVIHIRSGDIFNEWIHQNYVQPPLNYYKKIIEEVQPRRVVVVTQKDKSNPCINELIKWDNNITVQCGTLEEDVNTIMSAEKLVIGFGTWGWLLSLMSTNINSLWCPRICTDILDSNFSKNPFNIKRYDFENYIKIGDWECSEEQKNIMIGDVNVIQSK